MFEIVDWRSEIIFSTLVLIPSLKFKISTIVAYGSKKDRLL